MLTKNDMLFLAALACSLDPRVSTWVQGLFGIGLAIAYSRATGREVFGGAEKGVDK